MTSLWSKSDDSDDSVTCLDPVPVFRVSDQVPHKLGCIQPQKMARGLKFWIGEEEGLHYLCGKNKSPDLLGGYRIAELRLCFCISIKQVFS